MTEPADPRATPAATRPAPAERRPRGGVVGVLRSARRRVRLALLVGGFVDGLAALCVVSIATLLVLRLFGLAPFSGVFEGTASVSPMAAALLLVPVAAAVLRMRRAEPSEADLALHLDRRLEMKGLLLCGVECDAAAWTSDLDAGLADARDAMPRVRWGRAAGRALVPLAALAGVLLLPPPALALDGERNPALASALERFERRFEEIARLGGLREEARQEIEKRVESMKERKEKGAAPSWSDLDAAEEKVSREVSRRAADLAKAKASMASFAGEKHESGEAAKAEMAALVDDAQRAGLLDASAQQVAELAAAAGLDPSRGAEGLDPKALKADAEALAALAKALEGTAGARLEGLERMGAIDAADLEALKKLMEGDPIAGKFGEGDEVCRLCHGERSDECDG